MSQHEQRINAAASALTEVAVARLRDDALTDTIKRTEDDFRRLLAEQFPEQQPEQCGFVRIDGTPCECPHADCVHDQDLYGREVEGGTHPFMNRAAYRWLKRYARDYATDIATPAEQQPEATRTDKLIVLLTRAQPYVSRSSPIYDAITEAIGRESQTPTTTETTDGFLYPVADSASNEFQIMANTTAAILSRIADEAHRALDYVHGEEAQAFVGGQIKRALDATRILGEQSEQSSHPQWQAFAMRLQSQVHRLSDYLVEHFADQIGEGSTVDEAIKLVDRLRSTPQQTTTQEKCDEYALCGCASADDLHCQYCCLGVETHSAAQVARELVAEAHRFCERCNVPVPPSAPQSQQTNKIPRSRTGAEKSSAIETGATATAKPVTQNRGAETTTSGRHPKQLHAGAEEFDALGVDGGNRGNTARQRGISANCGAENSERDNARQHDPQLISEGGREAAKPPITSPPDVQRQPETREKIEQFAYEIHESFHVGCPSTVRPGCIDFIKQKFARTFLVAPQSEPTEITADVQAFLDALTELEGQLPCAAYTDRNDCLCCAAAWPPAERVIELGRALVAALRLRAEQSEKESNR